jgi:hypothetical protein
MYALCLLLWVSGLGFSLLGLWMVMNGAPAYGGLALLLGGVCAAAGFGLYRLRRWGVVLFAILGAAGAVNHIANLLTEYADLANAGPGEAMLALFRVMLAMLIMAGLVYLTFRFWQRAS